MSNPADLTEEDLIIIPDNSQSEEASLLFWNNEIVSEPKKEESILENKLNSLEWSDLFTLTNNEPVKPSIEPIVKIDENSTDNSFFDFWSSVSDEKKEVFENLEPVIQITQPIIEEKLNVLNEVKITEKQEVDEDEDLNHIIDWTIAKLDLRSSKIWWKKQKNLTKIEDLKLQISNLEKEKLSYEEQNTKLDEESKKIWLNKVSLEKMKLSWKVEELEKKEIEKKVTWTKSKSKLS